MRRGWLLVYILLVATLLFVRYRNVAYDDVFITYRYSANLASGVGLVYNPGERVLSTTSLLWTALLSPVAALGWDMHAAALLLGALSLAAGGYSLWRLGWATRQPWIAWSGLLLYPQHPLVTGTLGSETPLYLALGLGALVLWVHRRPDLAACAAGLAAAARPDGLLFAALLALDGLLCWQAARRSGQVRPLLWRAAGIFLLTWLPWVLGASLYYGSPLPATLFAKQQQAQLAVSASFWEGAWQTLHTLGQSAYFRVELFLAVLGFIYFAWRLARAGCSPADRRALADLRPLGLLLAWSGAYFIAYAALGVPRYFWYYAPLLPALLVGVGLGLAALEHLARSGLVRWEHLGIGARTLVGRLFAREHSSPVSLAPQAAQQKTTLLPAYLAWLVCPLLLLGQVHVLAQPVEDARYRVYRQVGEWLAVHTDPAARVGTLEVGVIGYYARRPMVDFAGLLQPAVAAQLNQQGSYDRAALWAVQRYQPDALVLQDGLFVALENWLGGKNCAESARFPGLKWDMVVYTCSW